MGKIDRIIDSAFPDLSPNALETMEIIERTMGLSYHASLRDGEIGKLYCRFRLASAIKLIDDYLLGRETISEEDRVKMLEVLRIHVH